MLALFEDVNPLQISFGGSQEQMVSQLNDTVIIPLQKNIEILRQLTNGQRLLPVPGAAFATDDGGAKTLTSGGYNPGATTIMRAAAYLPHMSRVSEIRYFVHDAAAAQSLTCALVAQATDGTETVLGTAQASTGSAGAQTLTDEMTDEVLIDNSLYAYYIRVTFSAAGNTDIRIIGARIYYYE